MSLLLSYQYARTNSGTFWDSTSLQDPEVDAIIDRVYETVDTEQRDKLSHEFERMLARANDLGLFAEEIDPQDGSQLGNFPQAFTHVGVISAALALARCQEGK